MAILPQPPFWIPRPGDPADWAGPLIPKRLSVLQILSQPKIFGAGGQVPTKFWWPYELYNDASQWNWPPQPSWLIPNLTQQKIFGAGGQVPVFRPNFTLNDASVWNWPPQDSWLISELTQQKLFNAGGQVVLFRPNFTYDDASAWTQLVPLHGSWQIYNLTQQTFYSASGQVPPFRPNFTYDDAAFWQWPASSRSSYSITLTTTQAKFYGQSGQDYPFRWNATLDDSAVWTWPPQAWNRNTLGRPQQPAQISGQRPAGFYSEDAFWQGSPQPMRTVFTESQLYGQSGQVIPFRPNVTLDDAGLWLGSPQAALRSVFEQGRFYGQPGQVPPFRWNATLDDPPAWRAAPLLSYSLVITTTQAQFYGQPGQAPPFRPNFTADDPAVWTWPPQARNRNTLVSVAASPTTARTWAYNYDETAPWQPFVLPAAVIYRIVVPPPPAANVVYALVRVTATFSTSAVSSITSISVARQMASGSVGTSISSVSRIGGGGSESEVS